MIREKSAGGVVVNNEKKVCLVSRTKGYWMLPKGGLEGGETFRDAAIREVMEETGLKDLKLIKKLGIVRRRAGNNPNVTKIIHYFLFRYYGDEKLSPTMEILEAGWFTLDNILNLRLFEEEKEFLDKHKNEIFGG